MVKMSGGGQRRVVGGGFVGRRTKGAVRLLLPKIDSAALMSGTKQGLEEGYPTCTFG